MFCRIHFHIQTNNEIPESINFGSNFQVYKNTFTKNYGVYINRVYGVPSNSPYKNKHVNVEITELKNNIGKFKVVFATKLWNQNIGKYLVFVNI